MLGGIYRIHSKATDEYYYGSTRHFSRRFTEHKSMWKRKKGNKKIKDLYEKYGVDNFSFEILEYCPKEEFEEKERQYIAKDSKRLNVWILPFSPKGSGSTFGENMRGKIKKHPFLGKHHTEESKEKFRKSINEYYKNNDGYWKYKSLPKEVKDKIGSSLKNYFFKNDHPNKGKSMSEESKKKISDSLKNHFAKNGSPSKGKVLSDETKLKISNSKKKRGVS